tara:strand:- start:1763 stop:2638 length:876 start_codon:yes stop_codon:yes gene_type:complete
MIEKIYIPTFRRVDKQITLDSIPQEYKSKVVLVVQEQERDEYKYDVDYLVVDNDIGIAKTRECIYRDAKNIKYGVMDDDVVMFRRNSKYYGLEPNMDKSKKPIISKQDWDDMFKQIDEFLEKDNVLMVGHREHTFPPSGRSRISKNCAIFGCFWIDGKKLSKFIDEVDWCEFQLSEDVALNFEILIRGWETIRMDEFCQKQSYNNNAPGGCEEFRNKKLYEEVNKKILKKWPDYVYVYEDKKKITESYLRWKEKEIKKLGYWPHTLRYDFKKAHKVGQMKKQGNLEQFIKE